MESHHMTESQQQQSTPAPATAARDSAESFLPQSTVLLVDDNVQNL
jgi:hypothetical protein